MANKTVLIDLSGTLHIEDQEITGSIEALKRLRQINANVLFVTNTTKEAKRVLFERLINIGFSINKHELYTSLTAAVNVLKERTLRPLLIIDDKAIEDFDQISQTNPNCVVVGLAPTAFTYSNMNEAFQLLLQGASLIAIHKARYYKTKDGLALGPGPFITGLEYSSGCQAEVIGKPSAQFFLSAVKQANGDVTECYMVGDDVRDDIEGAQCVGVKGILVKTGKYRDGDENKITPPPYAVVQNFSDAVDFIINDN